MKRMILALMVLMSLQGAAQLTDFVPYRSKVKHIGIAADSLFYIPVKDTNYTPARLGAMTMRPADSCVYVGVRTTTGVKRWERLAKYSDLLGAAGWDLAGNALIAGVDVFGSTNNTSVRLIANNVQRVIFDSTGKVGIGLSTPDSMLTVEQGIWGKRGIRFSGLPTGIPSNAKRLLIDNDGKLYAADTTAGGGGGSQNLQQVTDQDSVTTNSLYVGSLGYTRNTDTVQASGYESISTSTPNFIGQNLFVLSVSQQSRVRQTGNIQKIKFYTGSLDPALTAFYIDVWRYNGSTFDRVQHFNATSQIVGGQIETVFCTPSLAVLEGDYIGMSYTCSSTPTPFVTAINHGSLASYYTNSDPGSSAVNWTSLTSSNYFVPIHIYMQAPHMVAIGNSIMSGVPYHNSYISPTISNSLSKSIPYKVEQSLNIVAQNMGLGGNTTTQMLARFHSDVVASKPTVALIEGGVNDVYFGATTATVISNYKAMLDSCVANNIKPYVLLILPWTNGTNSENMQVDTINYKIDSMITASYPTGRVIDCRPLVGEFRSGGTAGNYWDIQAAYDYDGVHFTEPANTVIAAAIAAADQSTAYKSNSIVHNGKTYFFPDSSGTLITAQNIVITAPGSSGDLLINDGGDIGTGGSGAMNYTTGSGLTINNKVSIPGGVLSLFDGIPNNTQVNTQTWGNNYGEAAQHWYDNGATARSGVGQATGELQFFIPGIFKFSFNEGGDLQTPGTNVLATIDPHNDVINLNLPTNVGTVANPSSTLKVFGSFAGAITTVTSNTTASISHYTILSDATSGNITITLPAASTCAGRIYIVKKIDASSNSVTIDGDSAETIDGAATVSTTTQWVTFQIQSNGANWYKLN